MNDDYERIATAIRFLEHRVSAQPSLDELAQELGLSPFHFQRLFRRWSGVSPKRFLQFLTVEHAKSILAESRSVLEAAYETGLSGPGRLHDHFVSLGAITPGQYKRKGADMTIRYGVHPSPFGPAFVATTARGVCALAFLPNPDTIDTGLASVQTQWPAAVLIDDHAATAPVAKRIFAPARQSPERIPLFIKGTNFQINVWKALLEIPPGHLSSYEQVATAIGNPNAPRAVGQAIAANPVAYLIPCHRVIRSVGIIGGYRWNPVRKRAMIAWEAAHAGGDDPMLDDVSQG